MDSFIRWVLFSVAVNMVVAQYGGDISNDLPQPNPGPIQATYGGDVPEFDCSGLENGNYPDPKGSPPHCNTFYYTCNNRKALKIECPNGLYYDPDQNWCESIENIEVCGGQKPTTMLPPADVPLIPAHVFDCLSHEDGFYPNPKDTCSDIYYACSGGLGRELTCPEGLVFDPEYTICNIRDHTFTCTGIRVTTMPPATPPPVPYEAPNYPVDCHGKQDGPYPDPMEKCSQVFYVCANEVTNKITCAGNTYFDYSKLQCDTWINVFDCSGQYPTPPADVPATYAPPKPVDFDCTNLEDGPHPDPKNQCSNIYYVCGHGVAHELTCPPNLYWDPEETICNGFGNIYACTGVRKMVTEPATPMITSPPRVPEYPCHDKTDGFYSDPQNQCSTMYFVCSKKMDHKLFCPAGLYFDIENEVCEKWENVFACSGTRPPPTTPAPPRDIPEPVPFDCHGLEDGDYPDPAAKCSHIYYSCSGGVATKRDCADGAYFDQEIGLCELYENVPECSGTYRQATTPFTPHDIEKYPFECERRTDGNYPEGDCEEYYWSCVGGTTFKIECPMGLRYDVELNMCDWDYHIPRCGGQRPTPPPKDTSVQPNWPFDCSKLADGSYPDPESQCSQTFYVCNSGHTNKFDCPGGLFFNVEDTRCDLKVYVPACGGSMPQPPMSYNQREEPSPHNRVAAPLKRHDQQSSYGGVEEVAANEQAIENYK